MSARPVNQCVDAVYVLTVKTFAARIAHVQRELARHGIDFAFVLQHDAADLDDAEVAQRFAPSVLKRAQQSVVLKHVQAWRNAVASGQRRILVFEDDVMLSADFVARFDTAMRAADDLPPGWLVFLGGADTKVPDSYFLAPGPLIALPIATAEAYVTDLEGARRRLAWIDANRVALTADHLMRRIDPLLGIAQYWLRPPIAEQGSCLGLFDSTLDANRQKHSRAYTVVRYRWMKFQRHGLRRLLAKARAMIASR